MILRDRVKNGVIVVENSKSALPEGTLVRIAPLDEDAGSPSAIVAAMEALPHVAPEDVGELERAIEAGSGRPGRIPSPSLALSRRPRNGGRLCSG